MQALDRDHFRRRVGTTLLGKWRLERLLGVGGMAAVYEAVHKIGRREAIKILHPEVSRSPELRARFEQEARAVNAFRHRGAVEVRDVDTTEDGLPFMVMELLVGESLGERQKRTGRMAPAEVLRLTDELLDVLGAAHAVGIIHRDVKLDNLFLLSDGQLKVLDFGIARLRDNPAARTLLGTTLGTVPYMPPEQIKGVEIDPRVDLFATGAVMFRLLADRTVHLAQTEAEMLVKMLTVPAPALATVLPGADPHLCQLVDRALAFGREHRYPDARTMQLDLRAVAAGAEPPYAAARLRAGDRPDTIDEEPEAGSAAVPSFVPGAGPPPWRAGARGVNGAAALGAAGAVHEPTAVTRAPAVGVAVAVGPTAPGDAPWSAAVESTAFPPPSVPQLSSPTQVSALAPEVGARLAPSDATLASVPGAGLAARAEVPLSVAVSAAVSAATAAPKSTIPMSAVPLSLGSPPPSAVAEWAAAPPSAGPHALASSPSADPSSTAAPPSAAGGAAEGASSMRWVSGPMAAQLGLVGAPAHPAVAAAPVTLAESPAPVSARVADAQTMPGSTGGLVAPGGTFITDDPALAQAPQLEAARREKESRTRVLLIALASGLVGVGLVVGVSLCGGASETQVPGAQASGATPTEPGPAAGGATAGGATGAVEPGSPGATAPTTRTPGAGGVSPAPATTVGPSPTAPGTRPLPPPTTEPTPPPPATTPPPPTQPPTTAPTAPPPPPPATTPRATTSTPGSKSKGHGHDKEEKKKKDD
ncbi:MAG: protein kinase [Polyangiaceae bacterium]|nr:protein kinase [Polyangiaceae bacterium]